MAIEPDPGNAGSSFARVDRYLTFDSVVPQQDGSGRQFEAVLRVAAPASRGSAIQGRSIRLLSSEDFAAITLAGLHATFDPSNAIRLQLLIKRSCDAANDLPPFFARRSKSNGERSEQSC